MPRISINNVIGVFHSRTPGSRYEGIAVELGFIEPLEMTRDLGRADEIPEMRGSAYIRLPSRQPDGESSP